MESVRLKIKEMRLIDFVDIVAIYKTPYIQYLHTMFNAYYYNKRRIEIPCQIYG